METTTEKELEAILTDGQMTDTDWQIVRQLVKTFADEQLRIEPNKNGLTTELKKVIAYLYAKANDKSLQPIQISDTFFKYLNILSIKGKQIARSGKTPDYYRCIDRICTQKLKTYRDRPVLMLQILGWTARLVPYYKDGGMDDDNASNSDTSGGTNHSKPKPKHNNFEGSDGPKLRRSDSGSDQGGKTVMELALERAQKQKKHR